MKGRFTKGRSGNPSGRPKTPEDLKDCTPDQLKARIWALWKMPPSELLEVIKDPNTRSGDAAIASVLINGIKKGDHTRLDFLLNRLVGKVKEEISIETSEKVVLPTIQEAKEILARDYATLPAPTVKVEDL